MGLPAFGLALITDERPPGAWRERPLHEPSLQIRQVEAAEVAERWSGLGAIGWEGMIDGAPFVVERGLAGDHRFIHGAPPDASGRPSAQTRAIHHLQVDATVLSCAPSDPLEPSWWRLVLDSVLFTVSLLRDYEALHAGAIATPTGAIAIAAGTGGGKSTLLAELLARGLALMADDVLVLEPNGSAPLMAHPGPPLMTVPAHMPALRLAPPPEVIASIGNELWIAVPAYPEPLPLKALIVLDRRPDLEPSDPPAALARIDSPLAELLGSLMRFPRDVERQRTRFELASAVASTAGLWRLTAKLETPASVLADTLLAAEL